MLAIMPSFEDFDGDFPQTGFSHNFLDRIRDYDLYSNEVVLDNFSAGGASEGLGYISETVSFFSRLMVWMNQTHQELQKGSSEGSVDNWKYVCHCV